MKEAISRTTTADRLLLFLLVFGSIGGIFISREAVSQGTDVVIELNGQPAYTFLLSEDREIKVAGPAGEAVIEIRNRNVRVKEAHCPNLTCMKQGWTSRGVIVCLPNRLVVFVGRYAQNNKRGLDALTG